MKSVVANVEDVSPYLELLSDELRKMGFDDDEINKGLTILQCLKKIIGE